jgi:hypothetical protein
VGAGNRVTCATWPKRQRGPAVSAVRRSSASSPGTDGGHWQLSAPRLRPPGARTGVLMIRAEATVNTASNAAVNLASRPPDTKPCSRPVTSTLPKADGALAGGKAGRKSMRSTHQLQRRYTSGPAHVTASSRLAGTRIRRQGNDGRDQEMLADQLPVARRDLVVPVRDRDPRSPSPSRAHSTPRSPAPGPAAQLGRIGPRSAPAPGPALQRRAPPPCTQ